MAPAAELELVLRLPRKAFAPGEAIPLECRALNRSKRVLTVWRCGFCPNHRLTVKDLRGREPPLTAQGKDCRKAFGSVDRDKDSPVEIQPGGEYLVTSGLDLTSQYVVGPGRYRVELTYEESQDPTPLKATSKPLAFEVRPR